MPHPPEVLERIRRIIAFHDTTKLASNGSASVEAQPSHFLTYPQFERTPCPTNLLDAPTSSLQVLANGISALPDSLIHPPQTLKTLATWLQLAAGMTRKIIVADHSLFLRACPSAGASYPCELYVLNLGIKDLRPGLYHFSTRDFSLYRLRDGWESLAQLKRGRPDLDMLKAMPAIILVSTLIHRSTWKYGPRGYRYATIDAGHVIENLVHAGTGLGIQMMVRLHLNDRNTRELIGVTPNIPYDQYEAVQGFVAWADLAVNPIPVPAVRPAPATLAPIARASPAAGVADQPAIRGVHDDCIAPGVGVNEVRPPHTDRCPLIRGARHESISREPVTCDTSVFQALQKRHSTHTFDPHGISRDHFAALNRLTFRGGTYHPLMPGGAHMGLLRPFWFVHNVTGLAPGVWYYHANHDEFTAVRSADLRFDAKYLFDQQYCGDASAICIMIADLANAMHCSGPDAYRLAHLEAGVAGARLYIACTALDLQCCAAGSFNDIELAQSLDLTGSDWQCIYAFAVGGHHRPNQSTASTQLTPAAESNYDGPELK